MLVISIILFPYRGTSTAILDIYASPWLYSTVAVA